MKWKNILITALLCCLPSCIQVDPISADDLDDSGVGSRLDGTGSGHVRPPENWRYDSILERDVPIPAVAEYPELPLESIKRVKRRMTKSEVFSLLGDPVREDVELQNVDSGGNDYNATVYTWRYSDQRHASHPLLREFVVRFAWVDNGRSYPQRPEVVGPDWIVMSWDLY